MDQPFFHCVPFAPYLILNNGKRQYVKFSIAKLVLRCPVKKGEWKCQGLDLLTLPPRKYLHKVERIKGFILCRESNHEWNPFFIYHVIPWYFTVSMMRWCSLSFFSLNYNFWSSYFSSNSASAVLRLNDEYSTDDPH